MLENKARTLNEKASNKARTIKEKSSNKKIETFSKETSNKDIETFSEKISNKENFNQFQDRTVRNESPKKEVKTFGKNEFLAIRRQSFRLKAIEERLERIRIAIGMTKPNLSDMPGVPRDSMKSDLSIKISELLEISSEYSKILVNWNLKITKLEKQIESLPVGIYKVLHYRYFVGLNWEKIAELVNYNADYCRQLDRKYFEKTSPEISGFSVLE